MQFAASCPVFSRYFSNHDGGGLTWNAHIHKNPCYSLNDFFLVFRSHSCPDSNLHNRHIYHHIGIMCEGRLIFLEGWLVLVAGLLIALMVFSLCGCGFFLLHIFWVVGFVGFLFQVIFCLLLGCGVGGFGFTSMLVWLVVDVGYVGVSGL